MVAETEAFEHMKHDADLLPRIQRQIETVLRAFGRFEPITYDTQGFRDDGVDLAVRCERERSGEDRPPEIVGFQVKSFDDLRKNDVLRELKAQHDDARRKVGGLGDYFILLCTNQGTHKGLIRIIETEFRSASATFVIEPTYVYRFLTMPLPRVEGLIARAMEAGDCVFKSALEAIDVGRVSASLLAVYIAAKALAGRGELSIEELSTDPLLTRCYDDLREAIVREQSLLAERAQVRDDATEQTEDSFDEGDDAYDDEEDGSRFDLTVKDLSARDLLSIDLEVLNAQLVDTYSPEGVVRARLEQLMPVIALLADAQVRYDLPASDLPVYGLNALGVLDG